MAGNGGPWGQAVKPSSGILLPNGVKAGTHRLLLPQDFLQCPGKPLVDAPRIIRGEENYASRFISLMCEKEPELKIAQQLVLEFYRILKT